MSVIFPQLTQEQCALVLAWIEARIRPWADVRAELEDPDFLVRLADAGIPPLDPKIFDIAGQCVLQVGGSNGNTSFKEVQNYIDIDVFFMPPAQDFLALTPTEVSQLANVLNRRMVEEVLEQRDRCTIEGVAYSAEGKTRKLDFPKIGILYNGVIWSSPSYCRHCRQPFYDGHFVVNNGLLVHESCLGA